MKILRVFPSRTTCTPSGPLVRLGFPGPGDPPECDEVHISVTFTWDKVKASVLFDAWSAIHPRVRIGGPAYDDRGREFTPGMYLAKGNVITSRGCPNNCWFCSVPKREGGLREIGIHDGWKVHDSNILACSEKHFRAVCDMLKRQDKRAIFAGGLEAKILEDWHIEILRESRAQRMYFAFDTPDDREPLWDAGVRLKRAGVSGLYAYVLIGYPRDTFDAAERRIRETFCAGFEPFAMLYRDKRGMKSRDWAAFQRKWMPPVGSWRYMTEKEKQQHKSGRKGVRNV